MKKKTVRRVKRQGAQATRIAKTVGIIAIGATAGSIVTLLFAPASGRVTRRRIGLKVRALRRETVRQIGQAKKLLAVKAQNLRETASEGLVHAREWVQAQAGNGHSVRRTARRHA